MLLMRAASIGGRGVDPRRNVKRDIGMSIVGVVIVESFNGVREHESWFRGQEVWDKLERREAQIG